MSKIDQRRALEALRNGVPNREAVFALGCGQSVVEDLFVQKMADVESAFQTGRQPSGILVSGGFGTGKSHLLEYLEQLARDSNFVCSRVVISKETPLHDPGKVFAAAVESAVVPELTGQAIAEIALKLKPDSSSYAEFWRWANTSGEVSQIFPATLFLHERVQNDPELIEKIVAFWAGEKLPIKDVRDGLKLAGETVTYSVKAVKVKQLALERFSFVSRLIRGAGFAGWILFIDEAELVGRYSLLQRGRSYAEIARWMGHIEDGAVPGLMSVVAITDDFALAVLEEKHDRDYVGPKLRSRGTDEFAILAARAEVGMRLIEREALRLEPPGEERLKQVYDSLRAIHAGAFDWDPPEVGGGDRSLKRPMRSYVRRWINEWDLKRLYPDAELQTEVFEVRQTYGEDAALEEASEAELPDENQD